ncbi:MAG: hypothetical protein WCP31_12810 [Chloroflexales bacterium]
MSTIAQICSAMQDVLPTVAAAVGCPVSAQAIDPRMWSANGK